MEVNENEISMRDLITDIYAVHLAMAMGDVHIDMSEELKKIGNEFLISRNMSFMSQHVEEVWFQWEQTQKSIREIRDEICSREKCEVVDITGRNPDTA